MLNCYPVKSLNFEGVYFRNWITFKVMIRELFGKFMKSYVLKKITVTSPISPQKWWNHFLSLMNRNIPHSDKDFEDTIN